MIKRAFVLAVSLALAGCATTAPQSAPNAAMTASARAEAEAAARAFMAGYAADLLAKDRAAVAARYDPEGAWMVFEGERAFNDAATIRALYASGWQPPETFAWRDLRYDVLTPDTVLVVGAFDWGWKGTVRPMSYTGVLRRGPQGWRVRFENEGREAQPAQAAPAAQ